MGGALGVLLHDTHRRASGVRAGTVRGAEAVELGLLELEGWGVGGRKGDYYRAQHQAQPLVLLE